MAESLDLIIFWAVVAARLLLPLLIPRFPLPGILLCLVVDGADYLLFQAFPPPLEDYQSFDKALDIFYLAIAYIATLRNWTDRVAFRLSRFLFYYRLVGVALFELVQWRPLLLIFPNTFEYFFIFYEVVRVRWDPHRLSRRHLVGVIAFLWLVIKLPQEYFIHIAQIDLTDDFAGLFEAQPLLMVGGLVAAFVIVFLLVVGVWGVVKKRLPPFDHPPSFAADRYIEGFTSEQIRRAIRTWAFHIFDRDLLEKTILVGLIALVFTKVILGAELAALQIAGAVVVVTVVNTILSHWLARRGYGLPNTLLEFAVVAVVNLVIFLTYSYLFPVSNNVVNTLFVILMLTLIIPLFDLFQLVYLMRFSRRVKMEDSLS